MTLIVSCALPACSVMSMSGCSLAWSVIPFRTSFLKQVISTRSDSTGLQKGNDILARAVRSSSC